MHRDRKGTARRTRSPTLDRYTTPAKSGMVLQSLEECGLGQRSSSTLSAQIRHLNKWFMLRSPTPSPAIALGDSSLSRFYLTPSQTRRFSKRFGQRSSPAVSFDVVFDDVTPPNPQQDTSLANADH